VTDIVTDYEPILTMMAICIAAKIVVGRSLGARRDDDFVPSEWCFSVTVAERQRAAVTFLIIFTIR
jgi:Na+-driven multidrug efflux pump